MAKRGAHEGSIFKRANGSWGAAIQVDGRRRYVYGRTRREVQEKLHALQVEVKAGLFNRDQLASREGLKTIGDFLAYWLEHIVKKSVRPNTWAYYELCVRRVTPHIGKIKLGELTAHDVLALHRRLLENDHLSPRSVRHCHAVLHNALNEALVLHYIHTNPLNGVLAPRVPRHEMRTLKSEQVKRLLEVSRGTRWHALWALLVATGLRLGEATALRWSDLDLDKGVAVVQRTLQRQRQCGLVFVEPKTKSSRRSVQLPPGLITALRAHCEVVSAQRAAADALWQDHNLVFPSLTGGPIDPARVNQGLHLWLHKAGLPPMRVHDMRHTAATLLLEAGTHPKVVQDLLGHSTIAMTLDLYSHVTPRLQQEATTRIQEILFSDETPRDEDVGRSRH